MHVPGSPSTKVFVLYFKHIDIYDRMQFTSKNLTISAYPFKGTGAACVVVGWDIEGGDPWVLDSIANGSPLYTNTHVDITAVLYSIFDNVRAKLRSGAYDAVKNKVYSVKCAVQGNEFLISITCNSNAGVIKKAISAVIKNASPAHNYLRYVNLLKSIGVKPDQSAFYHCVKSINDSIERGIRIVLLGKIGISNDKFQPMLNLLAGKFAVVPAPSNGVRRALASSTLPLPYASLNVGNGLNTVAFKKYLDESLKSEVKLTGGKIYIPERVLVKLESLEKHNRVLAYVDKLWKFESNTKQALMFLAGEEALLSTRALVKEGGVALDKQAMVNFIELMAKHTRQLQTSGRSSHTTTTEHP
jgi:hypothetical protein